MDKTNDLARLADLRLRIDAIDDQLLAALAERAAVVAEIWALKRSKALQRSDPERERVILDRMAGQAQVIGLERNEIVSFFRQVIGVARRGDGK